MPDGAWPASYNDAYLFGDFVCGRIFKLTPEAGGGYQRTAFATNLGRGGPVAMTFGPNVRSLYYTTYAGGDGGQIRRITYTQAPTGDSGNKDPDGTLLGKVEIPEGVANVVFGGPKRNRLFICATTSLYSVMLPVRGAKTF